MKRFLPENKYMLYSSFPLIFAYIAGIANNSILTSSFFLMIAWIVNATVLKIFDTEPKVNEITKKLFSHFDSHSYKPIEERISDLEKAVGLEHSTHFSSSSNILEKMEKLEERIKKLEEKFEQAESVLRSFRM